MSLRRTLVLALASVSFVSSAWASPIVLKPGESYTELSGGVTSANAYFGGADQQLPLGATFEQRTFRSHTELGWRKRTAFVLDVPVVSRTYTSERGGSATSTGLGDLGLGLRFAVLRGGMPLSLSLGWTAPMGGNRKLFPGTTGGTGFDGSKYGTGDAGLGQPQTFFDAGLQSLSASIALGTSVGSHVQVALGAGIKARYLSVGTDWYSHLFNLGRSFDSTNRFANLLTTDATLGLWIAPNMLLEGQYHGEALLAQGDAYDLVPGNGNALKTRITTLGPRMTWRVDDRMDVFAGAHFTLLSHNTLDANTYYAGMAWKQTGLGRLAGAFGGTKN